MDNISFNTRKSLCNHLGDIAGNELADFLLKLKGQLEQIERNKVDRMPVVPDTPSQALPVGPTPTPDGMTEYRQSVTSRSRVVRSITSDATQSR